QCSSKKRTIRPGTLRWSRARHERHPDAHTTASGPLGLRMTIFNAVRIRSQLLSEGRLLELAQERSKPALRHLEYPVAAALTAALVWLAQFHHFREFGLYEDDYWFISQAMGKEPSYLVDRFQKIFGTFSQGRPLGFFLPDLLSFAGDRLGGLPAIYLLGFLIVTLNTFLCFRLLRTRVPLAPAAVGAAIFCLFPPDTTKILLTHDFQLQPALTFALLAALAYMAARRPLAYVLAAGALLSYESGYLALFVLPLFARRWDRALPRAMLAHAATMIGVLVLIVLARVAAGEGRATESVGGIGE